ncbi:MAG: class I SAM-dependent methyltransferase [Nanoarchaeota archaeon]|nr:class I SAM-dependent methyltransferase [Nanoarchaeota archaeon]
MINNQKYWDSEFTKGLIYGSYPSKIAIKTAGLLIREKLINPDCRLLEIGGGYGRNSQYFAEHLGIKATVIDISQVALNLGQDRTKDENNPPKFVLGDILNLRDYFTPLNFDVVFHNFCLHLLPSLDRNKIYRGVFEVLKERGLFIGSYLSINDPDCMEEHTEKGATLNVRGKQQHFFSEDEIRTEVKPYFSIDTLVKSSDPEKIINELRNIEYYFLVGKKNA